ncbi:TetR/AcrR family transcriptional regulator [uncultured Maritalea sp.]|jgi:TetR/AcrR family transcriptional repressor of nem operon|uniref:TetR/AcrR family transcriptional regulator n=1 Tax=uncultured Maritalea sp. TaxID=757249 RepID=UPI002607ABFE|nr:TetR/AcrR family transcriptional regulator [uncultured Maritalea sp.]
MRVTEEIVAKNHERILETAANLFRLQGIKQTSLSDVMSQSGMTHGGFYRHFKSKNHLVAAALQKCMDKTIADLSPERNMPAGQELLNAFLEQYLCDRHLHNPHDGCAVVALSNEVYRSDDAIRDVYTDGIVRWIEVLSNLLVGDKVVRRRTAMQIISTLVGTMMVARAVNDEALSQEFMGVAIDRVDEILMPERQEIQ